VAFNLGGDVDQLALCSATDLVAKLQRGEVSSVQLVELYLERIERLNPRVNAVVTLDAQGARDAARDADAKRARGESLGPLHGLPMTVKDTHETAGMRTTAGAPIWSNHVPTEDSVVVDRLRKAGAIIMGKTNVPFMAGDLQSYNDIFGQSNNPWNIERTTGGSSGGAAAAVAMGLTSFEVGSDIGGSIRHPAHWCGVFGHKPSYGIVPQRGHIPPAPGTRGAPDLNVIGPLARDPRDLTLMLDVIAGPDDAEGVAWKLELPPPRHTKLTDFRVAAWIDDSDSPVDAPVRERLQAAVDALRAHGVSVDDKARPDFSLASAATLFLDLLIPIMSAGYPKAVVQGLEAMVAGAAADDTSPLTTMARQVVLKHRNWLARHERRERQRASWAKLFETYDVVLCPVNAKTAIAHDHSEPMFARSVEVNGVRTRYMTLMDWVGLTTLAFLPVTVLPVGRATDGLPVGMQVVAPYLHDRTSIEFVRLAAPILGGYEVPPGC
jgi:amidase